MPNLSTGRVSKIISLFLDVFYPEKCLICGQYGDLLCLGCADKIEPIKTSTCPNCGKVSELFKYCKNCRGKRHGHFADTIIVAAHYADGPLKDLLHSFKYLGFSSLSPVFAQLSANQISTKFVLNSTVIVPLPLHKKRKNARGYNQSELIARELSKILDLPGGDALQKIRETKPQVGLHRYQRLSNLVGTFVCQDQELIFGKNVILVDDVATTGATLNECAKVLKQSGAKSVYGVVVARNI